MVRLGSSGAATSGRLHSPCDRVCLDRHGGSVEGSRRENFFTDDTSRTFWRGTCLIQYLASRSLPCKARALLSASSQGYTRESVSCSIMPSWCGTSPHWGLSWPRCRGHATGIVRRAARLVRRTMTCSSAPAVAPTALLSPSRTVPSPYNVAIVARLGWPDTLTTHTGRSTCMCRVWGTGPAPYAEGSQHFSCITNLLLDANQV